jgi:hypothetical protein
MRGREAVALSVVHGGVNKHRKLASSQAVRQLYDMIANDKEYRYLFFRQ